MADRKNAYLCLRCRCCTITVVDDEGHAPQTISCRASGSFGDCPGTATSLDYPAALQEANVDADWELFRLHPPRSIQSTENHAVALACQLLTIRKREAVPA